MLLQSFATASNIMNEKIEITLRERGYRMTPQREMIMETLFRTNQHLTAEQIYEELHMRTRALNIATVYRTLDLLVDEGLASRVDLGEDRISYAASLHGPHIHLVCRQCGSVSESDHSLLEPLGKMLLREYGFTADLGHLSITGLCQQCLDSAQAD
jgi:Fur family ferric uptake transcriptional regulator